MYIFIDRPSGGWNTQESRIRYIVPPSPQNNARGNNCEKSFEKASPKLQLRGLLPKVITYNAGISAYAKGLQPQHALHTLPKWQFKFSCPM